MGPLSSLNLVCSVILCKSVRERAHPLYDTTHKQLGGGGLSLTELTEYLSLSKRMDSYEAGYLLMGKFASDDAINRESTSTSEP